MAKPASYGHQRCPTREIRPRRLLAVAPVDEAQVQRCAPARGDPGGVTHHPHDTRAQPGPVNCLAPEAECVDPPGGRVDDVGVVMFPSRLVLFGAVVVVHAEEHRTGLLRSRSEVHGGLAAPGAYLHERRASIRFRAGCTRALAGTHCETVEGKPFVFGHEALGGPRACEEGVESFAHLLRVQLRSFGVKSRRPPPSTRRSRRGSTRLPFG